MEKLFSNISKSKRKSSKEKIKTLSIDKEVTLDDLDYEAKISTATNYHHFLRLVPSGSTSDDEYSEFRGKSLIYPMHSI